MIKIEALLRTLPIGDGYTGDVRPAEGCDPALASIFHAVLQRDGMTCQCCGYQSKRFLEVQTLDGSDYIHRDNLITLCHFCRALWHVPVAVANGAVFLMEPRMTQEEMVRFSRAYHWLPNWSDKISAWESDAVAKAKKLLDQSGISYDEFTPTLQAIWNNPPIGSSSELVIRKIMNEMGIRLFFGERYKPRGIDALRAHLARVNVETNPYPHIESGSNE